MTTQRVGLPQAASAQTPPPGSPEWLRLAAWARRLSWLSLMWMAVEGGIAIFAGLVAGSVALIGFGLDSAIEGFASVIVVWRFTGGRIHSEHAERRAQHLVAVQFFILAPYVAVEAIRGLAGGDHPEASPLGIGLAISSLVAMPVLGVAKRRLGERLGSVATRGEGSQNLLCAGLAAALLIGLTGNAAFGLWWLDPAAGLVIAAVAVREGMLAWRGEGCDCATPALPLGTCADDTGCDPSCCP